ncbi:hypothetical protein EDD22DRAFT_852468 [Suillus occidentalis]|nr:hypothetical protein EDD22DRAFT_852468 [Suillus occidentalis]
MREMDNGRRETGDGRRETGDGRRETGDGRRETGDGRWETGDGRIGGQLPQCKTQESENWKTAKPDNGRDRNAGRNQWGKFRNTKAREPQKSAKHSFWLPVPKAQRVWTSTRNTRKPW